MAGLPFEARQSAVGPSFLRPLLMFYVYVLRSLTFPDKIYVGHTNDLKRRLDEHNSGASFHTSKYQPWKIECYLAFDSEDKAIAFEKWLKSGNGVVFRNKHLIQL